MEQVEYRCLLPHEFAERFDRMPLAYVPVGSLEWHGEHLCLGNDGVKIEELCKLAALSGGGIVLPCVYLGIMGMTGWAERYCEKIGNQGIFSVEPRMLRWILTAQLRNLDALGFKGAIVITGHYPEEQVDLVRQVVAEFEPERALHTFGTTDRDLARSLGHNGDHAAKWETSILMALRPELVDLSRLPAWAAEKPEGVYGDDPRTAASPELGSQVVEAMVAELCAMGRQLVEQSR
jgi:creatinine amidohydrolase